LDGEPARDGAQSLRTVGRLGRLDGADVRDVERQQLQMQHRGQVEELADVLVSDRLDLDHEIRDHCHPDGPLSATTDVET
jgi:hypothetical protein